LRKDKAERKGELHLSLGEYVGVRLTSMEQLKLAQKKLKHAGFSSSYSLPLQKLFIDCPKNVEHSIAKKRVRRILESVVGDRKEKVSFT